MSMRPARKAVVVANGTLSDLTPFQQLLTQADIVVAADGGARALLDAGQDFDAILGDFDSLDVEAADAWRRRGGAAIAFPVGKDETDLELALQYVLDAGASRIAILGALGGRLDHELANLLLLASPRLANVDAQIIDRQVRVRAVRGRAVIDGLSGDLLSLLPVTERIEGVRTGGLSYALSGDTLLLGPSRGVSNVFVEPRAFVEVRSGVLLAVHTWTGIREANWDTGGGQHGAAI